MDMEIDVPEYRSQSQCIRNGILHKRIGFDSRKKNVKYIPFSLQIFPKPSIFVPKSDDGIQFIRSIIPYNMHHSSPKSKNQSCNGDVGI